MWGRLTCLSKCGGENRAACGEDSGPIGAIQSGSHFILFETKTLSFCSIVRGYGCG